MNANTYLSLNVAEVQCLQTASFEAIGLYLLFKEKANFRTGEVGRFHKQKLTYAQFARALGRPASQGRAAQVFGSTDIKRLIGQLTDIGLVEGADWDGTRLTLRLPLSPNWKGNPALVGGEKLPRQAAGKSPAEADGDRASAASPASLSVLSSERGSAPFFTTTAINTDTGGEEPAAGLPKVPAPAATSARTSPATATSLPLAEQFQQLVAEGGGMMAATPVSWDYYRAWAKAGVRVEQVRTAIFDLTVVEPQPFRPGDINALLFPRRRPPATPPLTEQQRARRGGVVL